MAHMLRALTPEYANEAIIEIIIEIRLKQLFSLSYRHLYTATSDGGVMFCVTCDLQVIIVIMIITIIMVTLMMEVVVTMMMVMLTAKTKYFCKPCEGKDYDDAVHDDVY